MTMSINLASLSSRVLTPNNYSFTHQPSSDLSLSDLMVCYSDSYNIKAVSLDIMKRYPILHDISQKKFSLIVCPYTLMTVSYEYLPKKNQNDKLDNNIIISNFENNTLTLSYSTKLFNMYQEHSNSRLFLLRHDVQIKTLKNVFTDHIHASYLHLTHDFYKTIQRPILNDITDLNDLTKNKLIHPKTLIYVITYISLTNIEKSTIIVGFDANSQKITGFNSNSKFKKYFEKNKEKIKEKLGYITPMYWSASQQFYKKSPVIFLSSIYT